MLKSGGGPKIFFMISSCSLVRLEIIRDFGPSSYSLRSLALLSRSLSHSASYSLADHTNQVRVVLEAHTRDGVVDIDHVHK